GLAKGWQVATVFSRSSGRPFTPNLGSFDRSGQGTGWMRANCFADPIYDFSNPNGIITNASTAFGVPANGTLGTCGRNSARLFPFAQWDLNIIRQFKLQGSRTIQARWEIFNILNHVNFGSLQSTSVRSSVFGVVQDTPDVTRGNPVIAAGGPRAMQW